MDKPIEWNPEKNRTLIATRKIGFEEIATALDKEGYIKDLPHYNPLKYPNQRIFYLKIRRYIYMVPYVEDQDKIFLKTIIPSRKANRKYSKINKETK